MKDINEKLVDLERLLGDLQGNLLAFVRLFKLEYEVIGEHNIKKLEELCQEKATASNHIQDLYRVSTTEIKALASLIIELTGTDWQEKASLSGLKNLLQNLEAVVRTGQVRDSRLLCSIEKRMDRLHKLTDQCQASFWQLKPEVEKNRFIISRLLYNHQESYKFWQATAAEASSSYDKTGVRRGPDSISQFQTKV